MSSLRKTYPRRVTADSTSAPSKSKAAMKKELQHQQTFPFKLYEMVEYACDSEFADSLFWLPDGSAFVIQDKDVMMNELAPMFFKQTKFRSFTRQLNIWGFVRTETFGGVKGGWQHENFLRGRPDLLNGIDRTEVKSASKKSSSITMTQTSSRSGRGAASILNEAVVVADESSCSSSLADSQASLSFNREKSAQEVHCNSAAAIAQPVTQAYQGTVFQYFDPVTISSVNYEQSVQDSVSLSSSSVHRYSDDSITSTQAADAQQVEEMYRIVQPFNSDDLMYLASIFEKDEHRSNEGDLSSILSLNQEGSVQDYSFDL
ncbi:hypothetical protein ACHAWT_007359 [Skeletonema menzelii]